MTALTTDLLASELLMDALVTLEQAPRVRALLEDLLLLLQDCETGDLCRL